jgi:signal transduction histidine kinase/CheY-like chemotaxis protein
VLGRPSEDDAIDWRPDVTLATAPASRKERSLAQTVALLSALLFVVATPWARVPLAQVWAFIPIYESALVLLDLITVALLLGQFRIARSWALLALASGYAFTACATIAHALTFPGLFAPGGLLGAGPQSTAWIYMFWHGGFPLFVVGYVLLRGSRFEPVRRGSPVRAAVVAIAAAVALALAGTSLATAGQPLLPPIMQGNHYTPAMIAVVSAVWLASLVALTMLLARRRPYTVLDLWLSVTLGAWLFDIALAAVLNAGRFDLGFYAGRVYGLLAVSFVLVRMLLENSALYVRLASAYASEQQHSTKLDRLAQQLQTTNAELIESNQRLEKQSRVKSEFLANMSHELRTPLNAVIGLTHLLASEGATPQQAERLARVEGAAHHLLTIINDVLDVSRIDAGKLRLEERDFELPALMETVRSIVAEEASAKGLEVSVDDGAMHWLRGDDTRLRQALLNYAGNAVKFTQAGAIVLRARLLQEGENGSLLLRFDVEDTGIGVDAQQLPRLFEAFEQGDVSTTREHGGTGLGLAITRRLAELMGGQAGAQPRAGGGSVFWFTAWLGRGAAAQATEVPSLRADAALRQHHAGARVLVAEDNPINREVALALLRAVWLEVDFAEDGAAAIEKARQASFDLVLMDMHMPVMDGLQATRALRAMPGLQDVPILAMTADAFDDSRSACLAAGMNDFVSKPVEPQTLYTTLLQWLDRGRSPVRQPT